MPDQPKRSPRCWPQISLRRLLLVLMLASAAVGSLSIDLRTEFDRVVWNPLNWVLIGSAVGAMAGRPIVGAIAGLGLALTGLVLFLTAVATGLIRLPG